jgi:hypothetical protein
LGDPPSLNSEFTTGFPVAKYMYKPVFTLSETFSCTDARPRAACACPLPRARPVSLSRPKCWQHGVIRHVEPSWDQGARAESARDGHSRDQGPERARRSLARAAALRRGRARAPRRREGRFVYQVVYIMDAAECRLRFLISCLVQAISGFCNTLSIEIAIS